MENKIIHHQMSYYLFEIIIHCDNGIFYCYFNVRNIRILNLFLGI